MKDSVEITGNQFHRNISVELAGNFLDKYSTENFIKFSVNLTEFLTVLYTPSCLLTCPSNKLVGPLIAT